MLDALATAAGAGAQLCVFPELALTGFHRQIRAEASPELVAVHMQALRQASRRHSLAVVMGSPTFGVGRTLNSCVFVDEHGRPAGVVDKVGLTPAEETFFSRGSARSSVQLLGYRTTAILCREVEDLDLLQVDLQALSPQIIFWPGAMRPAVDGSESTHVQHAQRLARYTAAFIIQSNWPNSLNYPEESAQAGHSLVIGPDGTILFRLPMATAGVGVFELGQPTFEWYAQTAPAEGGAAT